MSRTGDRHRAGEFLDAAQASSMACDDAQSRAYVRVVQHWLDWWLGGGLSPWASSHGAGADVSHYLLDVEIIPEYDGKKVVAVKVGGVCTINARSEADGLTTFHLDLRRNMHVRSVSGDVKTWRHAHDVIFITLDRAYDKGESFEVAVDYDGYPDDGGWGAFSWWMRNDRLVVATLSDPFFARNWWPCEDALDDKATMQMHCTVPEGLVAVSNGVCEGVEPVWGGRVKYKWRERYPMCPYLAALTVAPFKRYESTYYYNEGDRSASMPVISYLYPDHWDAERDEPLPDHKAGCDELLVMLDKFSERFGPYPFLREKYAVVEADGLDANMEHQTVSSMTRVDKNSSILAHELAHQWWGDDVTCKTWQDIWLNEGFATYAEALYDELKPDGGEAAYWRSVQSHRPRDTNARVYRTEAQTKSVDDLFSGNDVYEKGGWVLHMLRHVVGTDVFFTGLREYRAKYTGGSATTAEFIASMSESFGHDLSWFTDQWIMSPGSPEYEWNCEEWTVAGRHYLKLAVWQKQAEDGFRMFTMPIDVHVVTREGEETHTIWNDDWAQFYVIPIEGEWVEVALDCEGGNDDRNWILWNMCDNVDDRLRSPPALLAVDVRPDGNAEDRSVIELLFSEDIHSFDAADVKLAGVKSGTHKPITVEYDAKAQRASLTYETLPRDRYKLVVFDDGISANGKPLDGEVDNGEWWDDTLLPSGDGQPGGDAVLTFTRTTAD
ncbi:MAG: M1 family metallopeptidase [Planctomycetota bacterium]